MHRLHADAAVLDRFLADDGGAPDQTQTDRYRWIGCGWRCGITAG
jgi:hypothetical protein